MPRHEDGDDDDEDDDESSGYGDYRPWSTYMCSCQENCMNCLCVPTCHPCFIWELLHYVFGMEWLKSFGLGLLLTPLSPLVITAARRQIRVAHKLQGNICVDVCCTLTCCLCSACQVRDEIHTLRRDHRWRLAFPPDPGPPKHSPYVAPLVEALSRRPAESESESDDSEETSDSEDTDRR
uniref:Placenta-specific gene 8 protein-like n=1 Tax=Mesocestoides corti TaxID=53468 RepID=A0A5K3FTW2_MESCO